MTITIDRTAMTATGKGCPPISALVSVLLRVVVMLGGGVDESGVGGVEE